MSVYDMGFPHSEISGSKVATHLPETYRSYAASFIATLCQGIHHKLLIAPSKLGASFVGILVCAVLHKIVLRKFYFILLDK